MEEALTILRDRLAKAEGKAARAEKAWESAKNEVQDLQTAIRVMSELSDESSVGNAPVSANVAERQTLILRLLRVNEEGAQSPADLYESYKLVSREDINIDTFRTTIWRMKDRDFPDGADRWLVKGSNGGYWKVPATFNTRTRHEQLMAASARMGGRPLVLGEEREDDQNKKRHF